MKKNVLTLKWGHIRVNFKLVMQGFYLFDLFDFGLNCTMAKSNVCIEYKKPCIVAVGQDEAIYMRISGTCFCNLIQRCDRIGKHAWGEQQVTKVASFMEMYWV